LYAFDVAHVNAPLSVHRDGGGRAKLSWLLTSVAEAG
jgi:hypothetical protein